MALTQLGKYEVQSMIARFEEISATQILLFDGQHIFKESALTESLIILSDLLGLCSELGHRITFDDDVHLKPDVVDDVTDLIRICRNIVSHTDAKHRFVGDRVNKIVSRFNMIVGLGPMINGVAYDNPYTDDVAYLNGDYMLFVNRHMYRAFEEAKNVLAAHIF